MRPLSGQADAEWCARVMSSSEPWVTLRRTYETSLQNVQNPEREVWVAWRGGARAGFAILSLEGPFVGYLQTLCMAEGARGQGLGSELLVATLDGGLGAATPQAEEGVTYAHKLTAEDHLLHWERSAVELHRVVRVGAAHTTFRGARLKVHAVERVDEPTAPEAAPGTFLDATTVATGEGALRLLRVQPEGKAPMDAAAWANGARPVGEILGA